MTHKRGAPSSNGGAGDGRSPKRNKKSSSKVSRRDTEAAEVSDTIDSTKAVQQRQPVVGATKGKAKVGAAEAETSQVSGKARPTSDGVLVAPASVPIVESNGTTRNQKQAILKPTKNVSAGHSKAMFQSQSEEQASASKDLRKKSDGTVNSGNAANNTEGNMHSSVPHAVPESNTVDFNMDQVAPANALSSPGILSNLTHLPQVTQEQLRRRYNLTAMRIAPSTQIERRVTQLIEHLSHIDMLDRNSRAGVALLYAEAHAANKLISVVEIAKRQVEEHEHPENVARGGRGGLWYQYNRLDPKPAEQHAKGDREDQGTKQDKSSTGINSIDRMKPGGVKGVRRDGAMATQANSVGAPMRQTSAKLHGIAAEASNYDKDGYSGVHASEEDEEEEEGEEEQAFESMNVFSDPGLSLQAMGLDPAPNKQLKPNGREQRQRMVRAVPVLTIFMSRVRVPELEATLGEQTNAPSKAAKSTPKTV